MSGEIAGEFICVSVVISGVLMCYGCTKEDCGEKFVAIHGRPVVKIHKGEHLQNLDTDGHDEEISASLAVFDRKYTFSVKRNANVW